jgi:hypothetical protein
MGWTAADLRRKWDALSNFLLCLGIVGFAPLLPFAIEWCVRRSVGTEGLAASSAVYVFGLGGACKAKLPFGLCLLAGFGLAMLFGYLQAGPVIEGASVTVTVHAIAKGAMVATLGVFAIERFVYLFIFGEEFGPFGRSKR